MRNDVVVFEFANPISGDEVAIAPGLVAEIAGTIGGLIRRTIQEDVLGATHDLDVKLVAVQRGSLLLGFLFRLVSRNEAEKTKASYDLLRQLLVDVVLLGQATGFFVLRHPEASPPQSDTVVNVEINTVLDRVALPALDKLQNQVASAGVEEVYLRVPDAPEVVIGGPASRDTGLVGSEAELNLEAAPFFGVLKGIEGPFSFLRADGQVLTVYAGAIELEGQALPVLVEWKSTKGIREAKTAPDGRLVRGQLAPLNVPPGKVDRPVPLSLRGAVASLVVDKLISED